jgi:exopolysaccharide biosynthesis polyprenyl glycosylphosphotransferase
VPATICDIMQAMNGYQAVIVSGVEAMLRNGIVKECIDKDINCYFIPHTGDVIIAGAKHLQSFSVPIMSAKRAMLRPEYAFAKRTLDILLAMIGLILASPFMLITAVAIKAYDHGPVLYKQIRLTKDGKRFKILKFRSMRVDAEKDGIARLAADHDDRITPVGRVIRAIRFDELPQIFNILMGDMSIVGPRPERPEIAAQYEKEMPAFSLRLQVKAGLTGTAQVYGRYNTEPRDKLKMDLMYINHMSLVEDLKLIFATVKILFLPESTEGVAAGQTTAMENNYTENDV